MAQWMSDTLKLNDHKSEVIVYTLHAETPLYSKTFHISKMDITTYKTAQDLCVYFEQQFNIEQQFVKAMCELRVIFV